MSRAHGPKIITDGLVMYLDAGNIKSFKGEPTTNLVSTNMNDWTVGDYSGGSGHTTIRGINELGYSYIGLIPGDNSSTNLVFESPPHMTLSSPAGKTYTASIDYYILEGSMTISLRNVGDTIYSGSSLHTIQDLGYGWKRAYAQWTIPSGFTGNTNFRIYPRNGKTTMKISRPQFEEKPYATHYVEGSRGKTFATGGGWIDLSGNNKHGTIVNSPTYSALNNGCLVFDGVDDYLTVGTGNDFFPLPEFTIDAWVKSPGLGGMNWGGIFSITYGVVLAVIPGGYVRFLADTGINPIPQNITTEFNVFDDEWHNIIAYTTGSFNYIYIDGVYNNSIDSIWMGSTRWPTSPVTIGKDTNDAGLTTCFKGSIASIKLYNRILSNNEILQNYNALKNRFIT